ncbi:MAG: glycine cleavage system protein GcvH [Planctomyces sp.]|nr:glycine cleavage system protein GcvH [Planctomyces sp.]
MNPASLRFTETHEWVSAEGNTATIGISDFAVHLLTDIVYMSLPKVGKVVRKGESIGEIESVKAVSDLYAPVDGEIIEVNSELADQQVLLSESPFEKGWIAKIRMTNPTQAEGLMNYDAYKAHCSSSGH